MARTRFPLVLATCVVVVGIGMVGTAVYANLGPGRHRAAAAESSSPVPPPPPPPPTLHAAPVTVTKPPGGFFAWAFYDRRTKEMTGSANRATSTNTTESMIKAWLVSDYLRRQGANQPSATALKYTSTAIRNSNDTSATWLYQQNGRTASISRLISLCGLKKTKSSSMGWSYTTMTAEDAVRMGLCVADGKAAGKWTDYVLEEMRHVQGTTAASYQQRSTGGGHWGIIDGLPENLQAETSIKNGWTLIFKDSLWHVNCLAIHRDWVLVVQVRLKGVNVPLGQKDTTGLTQAASVCESVATQLAYQPTAAG
jgi:hypothetical protein